LWYHSEKGRSRTDGRARKGIEMSEEISKEKTELPHYSIPSNILFFHRLAYRETPRLAVYHVAMVLAGCFLPVLGIWMPGIVLGAVERGALPEGLAVIAGAGLVMLICDALRGRFSWTMYFWENNLRNILIGDSCLKGMKCLYKYVEYGGQKKITRRAYQNMLRGDGSISYKMLDIPRNLLVDIICFFLYSTVLSILNPWMTALMLLLSLLNYGILKMKNRWELALKEEFAQSDRVIGYLEQAFQDTRLAKDVRIFAMNDWLMAFRGKVFGDRMKLERRNNRKGIFTDLMQELLSFLQNGFAYGYLIYAVLQGEISAAGFLVCLGAVRGFSGFVIRIVNAYSALKLENVEASCFRAHMELPEVDDEGDVPPELFRQPAEIEFRDVGFSYGEQKLYEHFNLTIRPGEKIALIGVNGAGKSTLVKLLCGLYEPDEGKILINGVDIAALPKKALYSLFSVVFQESALLPYPVGCNLSYQRLENTDEEKAWAALREAGLEEVIRQKGAGMDTFMQRQAFGEGVELSGGQIQKFLLARALYKDGNILILDEPTSALDPIAESEVYQEYVKISRGRTSLFISHRLASTKFSDRILFLEDGQIREEGTHEELMALGGSYAHMFEVQAHYYKEDGDTGEVPAGALP